MPIRSAGDYLRMRRGLVAKAAGVLSTLGADELVAISKLQRVLKVSSKAVMQDVAWELERQGYITRPTGRANRWAYTGKRPPK